MLCVRRSRTVLATGQHRFRSVTDAAGLSAGLTAFLCRAGQMLGTAVEVVFQRKVLGCESLAVLSAKSVGFAS